MPLPATVPRAISRSHLVSLYSAYLGASSRFASYNFRQYFLRRAREKFRVELPALLQTELLSQRSSEPIAAPASTSRTAAAGSTAPATTSSEEGDADLGELVLDGVDVAKLRDWYAEARKELGVLERASVMNRLYEAPRLVVEGAGKVMTTGGGGAGMEQA